MKSRTWSSAMITMINPRQASSEVRRDAEPGLDWAIDATFCASFSARPKRR
jgi:hypothetical protein